MAKEFHQVTWDDRLEHDTLALVQLAIREDLDRTYDWTTVALVDENAQATAHIVARQPGILAGTRAAQFAYREFDRESKWTAHKHDGDAVLVGDVIAELHGAARHLLTAERTVLNLLSRLCGIATRTHEFVEAVRGTDVRIYDTRKTTPGWRRLEKYAVRQGGGWNHRLGLFDAVLIKDNHLAHRSSSSLPPQNHPTTSEPPLAGAIRAARDFAATMLPDRKLSQFVIEIEVDTLAQLEEVLPESPDVVLLDNMTPETLRKAVAQRDAAAPDVQLEASGGITLDTIRAVAESGIDRISLGALTHSAIWLDLALDWAPDSDG